MFNVVLTGIELWKSSYLNNVSPSPALSEKASDIISNAARTASLLNVTQTDLCRLTDTGDLYSHARK